MSFCECVYHPHPKTPTYVCGPEGPAASSNKTIQFMETIAYLPIGQRTTGRVVKINSRQSARLKMFSFIVSFFTETQTDLGKTIANRGFFGIALTEQDPSGKLKEGDTVEVQIASYRTSEFGGQTNTAAQVNYIRKVDVPEDRVSAALQESPKSNQGTRQNA